MSIATEITRLQTAKSNIKTAIENKGVTVPSVTTLSGYNDLIGQIENINKVSSVPSTKSSDIIYNTSDSSYYLWDELSEPLCFTANTAGSTVTLFNNRSPWVGSYSIDGTNWITYVDGTIITLTNIGDKVYFKGDITENCENTRLIFEMTGSIAASGNCNSMYVSSNFENLTTLTYTWCFAYLFTGCASLTSAPLLPATTLSETCYGFMFSDCTSLTAAPELPATTLATNCYYGMFEGCTALTTAPATLPAITMTGTDNYAQMFYGCSNLSSAPALPATTLSNGCYASMFHGCSSLITAPALPATSLTNTCYKEMFAGCYSLTTPPALPATTLANMCYYAMFGSCESLQVSDTQTTEAQYAWTIPSSGTFTNTYSQSYMFANCPGTRSSDDMPGVAGQSYTYYTQNTPV